MNEAIKRKADKLLPRPKAMGLIKMSEDESERGNLDRLTNLLKMLFQLIPGVRLIDAVAKKDEWGGYTYDFTISGPLHPTQMEMLRQFVIQQWPNPTLNQGNVGGKQILRIIV